MLLLLVTHREQYCDAFLFQHGEPTEIIQGGWSFLPSVYAYRLPNQMPELKSLLPPTPPSLLLTGPLCFDFCQAKPVGW